MNNTNHEGWIKCRHCGQSLALGNPEAEALQQQVQVMREALEYFADDNNYWDGNASNMESMAKRTLAQCEGK